MILHIMGDMVLLVTLLLPIITNGSFLKPSIEYGYNTDANGTDTNYVIGDNGYSNVYDTNKLRYITENIPSSRSVQRDPLDKHKKLTIGYLTAIKGDLKERQGLTISGALTIALEEINNDRTILPNVTLVLKWKDTKGDTVLATRTMIDMISDGVTVFFGPEGSCYVEAIVAQSRNIPMISYKCSDYKASDIPTFARTEPSDTQVTKSVISLLTYYGWNKFSIIYEEEWRTVAYSLIDQAEQRNMTINNKQLVMDRYKCCEERMSCCLASYWYKFIQETKNKTRIYIFLGTPTSLIDLMNTMQTAQLFDNGEYMVITVDRNTYSSKDAHKYLWHSDIYYKYTSCERHQKDFLKRARSLLVVASTQPSQNYEQFTKTVGDYNTRDPFNFSISPFLPYQKFVSIHAAYLYDSVKLYAKALDKLLRDQPFLNDTIIDGIASNGTKIIETIIGLGPYTSITGATVHLDKNGDSEGNFSVLALKPSETPDIPIIEKFTCKYQMVPVGQFLEGGEFPVYKIHKPIDWAGGAIPVDEPSCKFENELCAKHRVANLVRLIANWAI